MTTAVLSVPSAAETLRARTINLVVRGGVFGNSRQASLADVIWQDGELPAEHQPDKRLLRLTKTLLDSPELRAVNRYDSETGALIRKMAHPSPFKGAGWHSISILETETIDAFLIERNLQRQVLVDAAVASYEQRARETSDRLGVVHSPLDYPSKQVFAAKFYFEWQWVAWETDNRLATINADLFRREAEKAQARLTSVAGECRLATRAFMQKLVDHLVERLTPSDDGKTKRFTQSTVANLHEFLGAFEVRDATDDTALARLVSQARGILDGVDAASLKGDEALSAHVLEQMASIKSALDPLVEETDRMISFE